MKDISKVIIHAGLYTVTALMIVASLLLAAFLLPPVQRWSRDIVAEELSKTLGVPVTIDGLKYFPFKTVGLNNLCIMEPDSSTMIFVGEARADIDLSSIWREKVVISSISASDIYVDARMTGDSLNLSILSRGSDSTAIVIDINDVNLTEARINYTDGRRRLSLSEIKLKMRDFAYSPGHIEGTLRQLTLTESLRTHLKASLETKFYADTSSTYIPRLRLKVGESVVDLYNISATAEERKIKSFAFGIDEVTITTDDIALLTSKTLPPHTKVTLRGMVKGSGDKLTAEGLTLKGGTSTSAEINGYIDGYRDMRTAVVDIDIESLKSSMADIGPFIGMETDEAMNNALSAVSCKGRLKGSPDDAEISLSASTSAGRLDATANARRKRDGEVGIDWRVKTDRLNLNGMTHGAVDGMSVKLEGDGLVYGKEKYFAHINGTVSDLTVNGYHYSDVALSSMLTKDVKHATLALNDPNGKVVIDADMTDMSSGHKLTLASRIDSLMTGNTNLTPHIADGQLSLRMRADFVGNNPDNANGNLHIADFVFSDKTRKAVADELVVDIHTAENYYKTVRLDSDNIHGELIGNFKYRDIFYESYYQLQRHASAYFDRYKPLRQRVDATFDLQYADANQYVQFIDDDLILTDKGRINGEISSDNHSSNVVLEIGDIEKGGTKIHDFALTLLSDSTGITVSANSKETQVPYFGTIGSISILNNLRNNVLTTEMKWDNNDAKQSAGELSTRSVFHKERDGVYTDIEVAPSVITMHGSKWAMAHSTLKVGMQHLTVNDFRFEKEGGNRYVAVNGCASENMNDTLYVGLGKLVIEDILDPDAKERYSLAGDLTTDIAIVSLFRAPIVNGNIGISRLYVNDDSLEQLNIKSKWSPEHKALDVDLAIVTGETPRVKGCGSIDVSNNKMQLDFDIDSLSVGFLNFYLKEPIKNITGTTSGKLQLHGPLNDIALDARLCVNHTDFTVRQTNVDYNFCNQDSVILSPTLMEFREMQFADRNNKRGTFSGYIRHDMFSNLRLFLDFNMRDQLVLDTRETDNSTYYGTIYADGTLGVRGRTSDVDLRIKAQTRPNTTFSILPMEKGEIKETSNIQFKKKTDERTKADDIIADNGYVTAQLDVHIDPSAQIMLIIDPQTNHKINATGQGDLALGVDRDGAFGLHGAYQIETGTYNFSFKYIVNKKFDIHKGSTLTWDGDPMNPIIDLIATYKVNASLYDLVQNATEGQDLKRRVPVNCNILLSERLANPDIHFKIEIPSTMNFNQYAFDQYVNTEEEMNAQAFSLLLTNKFSATQESASNQNNTSSPNYIGTAASELLSNQLSNWISQNGRNIDIGVNYRPGDEVTDEEYEVAVSTQVLNNKITLSGNIGYGRNTTDASESSVIGDFDIEYKMSKIENLRAKAYTHSNNDVIYETSPTTQGIGLSYTEEFNTFKELFGKYIKLFRRKRKDEVANEKEN